MGCRSRAVDDFECEGLAALSERERHAGDRWGGAVFDGQAQFVAVAAQIEVGVAPGRGTRMSRAGLGRLGRGCLTTLLSPGSAMGWAA